MGPRVSNWQSKNRRWPRYTTKPNQITHKHTQTQTQPHTQPHTHTHTPYTQQPQHRVKKSEVNTTCGRHSPVPTHQLIPSLPFLFSLKVGSGPLGLSQLREKKEREGMGGEGGTTMATMRFSMGPRVSNWQSENRRWPLYTTKPNQITHKHTQSQTQPHTQPHTHTHTHTHTHPHTHARTYPHTHTPNLLQRFFC